MESVCLLMHFPIVASAKMATKEPCATRNLNYVTHARAWSVFMVSARSQMQERPIVNATQDLMGISVIKVRNISVSVCVDH